MTRLGLLVGVAMVTASPAHAQRTDWPLRDRTLLGDGTIVTAVAAAIDRVTVVTPSGVLLLDPQTRQWVGPYQPPDPTVLRRSSAALLDPLDQSVWIQLTDGWLRFQPNIELFEQGSAPGRVTQIAFDADNPGSGLLLLVGSTWYQVPRGSSFPNPVPAPRRLTRPLPIAEVMRQSAGFAAMNGNGYPDGQGGLARYTAAAADPAGRGWWVGSAGAGLLFVPFGGMNAERIPYGLPSSSVAALFAAPNGVWVVTDQLAGRRAALAFIASDLSSVKWNEGPMATGLPFRRASRLVGSDQALWLGTDVGLIRFRNGGQEIDRFDEGRGLPDQVVLTVLARRGRILTGTAHGLVALDDSGRVTYQSQNFSGRVTALESVADTVWAGGAVGPMVLRPGGELSEPAGLDIAPAFHLPILAMATIADTVIALTTQRLEWRDPVTGVWSLGPMLESSLGRLETLVAGRGGVFVAGDRGVGHMKLNGLPGRVLTVPVEIPAPPRDLAIDENYLWVATNAGVVRWRLDAIVP